MELKLQSDQIDQLISAFIQARKAARPFKEDGKANYGAYVSIDEIKACTNQALLDNGLSLTQTRTVIDGRVVLVTKLSHVSGQWQASYVPLTIPDNVKNIDQAYGASMSYQRRYELYGLFAFKGEDLDPDAESKAPGLDSKAAGNEKKPEGFYDYYIVKDFQTKQLTEMFNKFENPDELKKEYLAAYHMDSVQELKQFQFKAIMDDLKSQL